MTEVIVVSVVSFAAFCCAGACYGMYQGMRKQRNQLAVELTAEKANTNSAISLSNEHFRKAEELKSQITDLKVDRQQNWVPKPKHGNGGKFTKKSSPVAIGSEIDAER